MHISRDFKGIWIPREIYLNRELKPLEKMLWAEIHSLHDRQKGGCYASNEYLAEHLGVSERFIREMISNLKKHKLIEEVSFDGRIRTIRACIPPEDFEEERNCSSGQNGTGGIETGTAVPLSKEPQFRAGVPPHNIEIKEERKEDIYPPSSSSKKSKAKTSYPADSPEMILCLFLFECMKRFLPDPKKPNFDSWANQMNKLIRIDKKTPEAIKQYIEWIYEDSFWGGKILSPSKLREKWDTISGAMIYKKNSQEGTGNAKSNSSNRSSSKQENNEPRFKARTVIRG